MSAAGDGTAMLIAPHRFRSVEDESALAGEHGLELVEARDVDHFLASLERSRLVMMSPYAQLDAAALATATACAAVVRYGAGVDNIDLDAATAAGIPVANVPDAAVEEVAIHAIAMMTSLARRLPAAERAIRAGDWKTNFMAGAHRFSNLTVGILGLGRIGSRTAELVEALGAEVIVHDLVAGDGRWRSVGLEELLARADIVSVHLPLTPATADILSRRRIEGLKPGAIVVNASRGGLVDEVALAEALAEGRIGGAGLDVFSAEPLPLDHPLLTAPNAVLTPHVAWRAEESARDYQLKAVEQARAALAGERMSNVVNPEAYGVAAESRR